MITGILDDPKRLAGLRRNTDAMSQLLADCRLMHHGLAKVWADEWRDRDRAADRVNDAMYRGVIESRELERLLDRPEPTLSMPANDTAPITGIDVSSIIPIGFNDPDDEENDLIGQWARKGSSKRSKLPGAKTVYEARRMMRKLTIFVAFDDLRRLTRKHVQDWVDDLKETKVAPGKKMASMTVSQNLIQLKALANFAVDREMIEVSPAAKVMYKAEIETKVRAFTDAEARVVLEAARRQTIDYKRWLPWLCCFMGARLDEPAGAAVADIEKIGSYWVIIIRLENRHKGASIKNESSVRKVPLHPALIREGFLDYVAKLPKDGALFPSLKPDTFKSKGGTATKRVGPMIRKLAKVMPSLADTDLSPSHSWRHRLHNECRRLDIREDVENALTGHAHKGGGPGYGEYAINDVLGPAMDRMRSPFDAP
jgi:integrase